MRIVPSCNLGSLTPSEGEPVLYTWRWYNSITGLGLWIVLVLAMLVPKANRTPKTLLILVPLAVAVAARFAFVSIMRGSSSDWAILDIMIYTLMVGSATLWLLAHHLAFGRWYKSLLAAMGLGLGVALVGGLSLGFGSAETLVGMGIIAFMMIVMVLGYALAARGYGMRRAWRFLVFQAGWTMVASFVGVFLMVLALSLIFGEGPGGLGTFLMAVLFGGLIMGTIVLLIALPFSILGLCCPFFRQRLILCLAKPGVDADHP